MTGEERDYQTILTVVPRERRPMASVEFSVHRAMPLANRTVHPRIVVIKPRSHRAYRVVTKEDAEWMFQVIDKVLGARTRETPQPPRSRSSREAPATDASGAASSTSTAAASAKRPRRTRQS